jgi:hypothetical protein
MGKATLGRSPSLPAQLDTAAPPSWNLLAVHFKVFLPPQSHPRPRAKLTRARGGAKDLCSVSHKSAKKGFFIAVFVK